MKGRKYAVEELMEKHAELRQMPLFFGVFQV